MFHNFFNSLTKSSYLSFFHILPILLYGPLGQQSFFFLGGGDYYNIWSFGRDLVIRLYLEIPEEFVGLIF